MLIPMPSAIGLCESCRLARVITSGKGSSFWLCRKSETDPHFPRYPALPVLRCAGYERKDGEAGGV